MEYSSGEYDSEEDSLDSDEREDLHEMGQMFRGQNMQEALLAAGFEDHSDLEDYLADEPPAAPGSRRGGWRGWHGGRERPCAELHTEWFLSCFGTDGELAARKSPHVMQVLEGYRLPDFADGWRKSRWGELWASVVTRDPFAVAQALTSEGSETGDGLALGLPDAAQPVKDLSFCVCTDAERALIRRGIIYYVRDAQCDFARLAAALMFAHACWDAVSRTLSSCWQYLYKMSCVLNGRQSCRLRH